MRIKLKYVCVCVNFEMLVSLLNISLSKLLFLNR